MSDGCRLALEYSEVEYAAGGGDAAQREGRSVSEAEAGLGALPG